MELTNNRMAHTVKKITLLMLALVAAAVVIAGTTSWFGNPQSVDAGANDNFSGFAWSDVPADVNEVSNPGGGAVGRGAGWISFNNIDIPGSAIDYGVKVDVNGNISGNAWSEHVGWISFNNVAGCPAGNCQPRIETIGGNKFFRGWARAMAYSDPQAGGWDGWISFSSENHGGAIAYGWTLNAAGNVSGYVWGGDILGWIVPYGLKVVDPKPQLVLVANPATVLLPNPLVTDLTYYVTNWAGTGSPFSSCIFTTNPTTGSGTDGTPINGTVIASATTLPITTNRTINSVRVYAPQTVYNLKCTPVGGGEAIAATATVVVKRPQPTATISGPSCVVVGTPSMQLTWTSSNVTSCSIDQGVGTLPTLNGAIAVPVGSASAYNIVCNGPYGTASATHTFSINKTCQSVTTGGVGNPIFNEI